VLLECIRRLIVGLARCIHAGVYITLPSAQDGCGSLQSDSYFWDTADDPRSTWNEPMDYYSSIMTVPKGTYYFYGIDGSSDFYPSDVLQYFCTGLVDETPVGSYCFYQNIQNCNFSFLHYILFEIVELFDH